jgi:hypothetical protein
MRTKCFCIYLITLLTGAELYAQDVQVSGNLKELKGVTAIRMEYDYSNFSVGEIPESQYVSRKMAEREMARPGEGEIWKNKWLQDRSLVYEPKFEDLFGHYVRKIKFGKQVESDVVMLVKTTFIEPGFYTGTRWGTRPTYVDLIITFTRNNIEFAQVKIIHASGFSAFGGFDEANRIGEAYAKAGKELAPYVLKAMK